MRNVAGVKVRGVSSSSAVLRVLPSASSLWLKVRSDNTEQCWTVIPLLPVEALPRDQQPSQTPGYFLGKRWGFLMTQKNWDDGLFNGSSQLYKMGASPRISRGFPNKILFLFFITGLVSPTSVHLNPFLNNFQQSIPLPSSCIVH